jgi:hypothetical protein
MLAKIGATVVGIDIAPAALELAQQNAERNLSKQELARISFRAYDGIRIPAEDGAFDFVLLFEAFHHLPNQLSLLREYHRVLSPHGILGFAEPGAGHSHQETSHSEMEKGVLERDVHLEQLYRSALHVGFRDMEVFLPAVSPNNFTLTMRRLRWFMRGMSWLVGTNSLRTAILTGPIGMIRKGKYRITSLHPGSLIAQIKAQSGSLQAQSGSTFEVTAEVTNVAETTWLQEGRNGKGNVLLGAHLLNNNREVLEQDFGRVALPRDLQTGEKAVLTLSLRAPATPGSYVVRLDLVNEGICWFNERGSTVADLPLLVR